MMKNIGLLLLLLPPVMCVAQVAPNFGGIVSGTNGGATMTVGSGATLGYTGSGAIDAKTITGLAFPSLVNGDCLTNNGSSMSWQACAGAPAFSAVTSGTNAAATMTVGTGASIVTSGTGSVAATITNGYATASLPTCNSGATGSVAYTTDGTAAFVFCNGSSWVGAGGTTFTITPTGCTPSAHAGSATAGTITLASGPCTAITITFNGAVGITAPTGWHCNVGDRTALNAGTWIPAWIEKSSTTAAAVIPIPGAAGATDIISFDCVPF